MCSLALTLATPASVMSASSIIQHWQQLATLETIQRTSELFHFLENLNIPKIQKRASMLFEN